MGYFKLILILSAWLVCTHLSAQTDSTLTETGAAMAEYESGIKLLTDSAVSLPAAEGNKKRKKNKSNFHPNPTKALLWSIIPGGGQTYNRKYWKIPIVYAGVAALTYAVGWNAMYYNRYHKAYIHIADNDPSTNYFIEMLPAGQTMETVDMAWFTNALNTKQLNYRRNRDLAIIGSVLFYALTFLDAYVDAQLHDFDINPDLSMRIKPTVIQDFNPALGLSCSLKF